MRKGNFLAQFVKCTVIYLAIMNFGLQFPSIRVFNPVAWMRPFTWIGITCGKKIENETHC
jgi:hypothetical protein